MAESDSRTTAPNIAVRAVCRRSLHRFAALGVGEAAASGILATCGGAATTPTLGSAATATTGTGGAAATVTAAPGVSTAPRAASPATGAGATATRAGATTPGAFGTPSATGTITFSVSGDTAEKDAYGTIVAAFNARQPRVTVNLAHIPSASDYVKRLTPDLATDTPPDIGLMNSRRFGAFAAKNAFDPLAPYLVASSALKQDAFYPEVVATFTRGGQLIGIPQSASSLVIYYFARLGLVDTIWSLIAPALLGSSPCYVMLYYWT